MKFPKKIPIFPLSNFIIFPKTTVPLNIFEPRYIEMINDSMKSDKLIGMIQPKTVVESRAPGPELHKIGCLGKISDLKKSEDGRILMNLTGITRFKILEEVENNKLYREFKVDYKSFEEDLRDTSGDLDTKDLMNKAKTFFKKNGLLLNWREFEKLDKAQRINTLSMISPVTNEEKQKLLEAITIKDKVNTLESIISFYLHEVNFSSRTVQ